MVVMNETVVDRPAASFSDAERDRLSGLLERYRSLVRRGVAGEALSDEDERAVLQLLESLWLVPGCWPRDVAAWREMEDVRRRLVAVRSRSSPEDEIRSGLAGLSEIKAKETGGPRLFASADPTLFRLRHRESELEVVHPHLFCSVHVAAFLRWDTARRAMRWSNERV